MVNFYLIYLFHFHCISWSIATELHKKTISYDLEKDKLLQWEGLEGNIRTILNISHGKGQIGYLVPDGN